MIYALSGGGILLHINGYASLPSSGKENEIAIITETAIPHYAIAAENPFLESVGGDDLLTSVETKSGYYGTNGSVSSQSSTNQEVYTELYTPVEYGKTYAIDYTLAASKSMWLAVCEYSGENFVQRLIPVNSVTGTVQAVTYTPSADTVTAVRLTWRTFGLECTVSMKTPIETVTKQDIENGTVWIKTGASDVSFFADRKQTLRIDPAEVYQYIDGAWMNKNAYAFQDGAWVQFWQEQLRLYWEGYENPICGGMSTAYGTKEADHISFRITSEGSGIEGRANTAEPVVLDPYKTLYAEVNGGDWRARTMYLGIRETVTGSFAASVQPASDWSGTEKVTLRLDVTDITGSYYCLVKNASSGVGNELHRMWLE